MSEITGQIERFTELMNEWNRIMLPWLEERRARAEADWQEAAEAARAGAEIRVEPGSVRPKL
jgi:hypothetical protein